MVSRFYGAGNPKKKKENKRRETFSCQESFFLLVFNDNEGKKIKK